MGPLAAPHAPHFTTFVFGAIPLESLPLPSPALIGATGDAGQTADVTVLGLRSGSERTATWKRLDEAVGGKLEAWADNGLVTGELGELSLLGYPGDSGPAAILVVGLGPTDRVRRGDAFRAAAAAIRRIADRPRSRVVVALGESFPAEAADAIVSGALAGCEVQSIYQSDPHWFVPDVIAFPDADEPTIRRGQVLGQAINHSRRLINEPASVIYPESFARRAGDLASEAGLEFEVWDEQRLADEGCRAMLAVGAGSTRPPRLVFLRHRGGGDEPPVILVGKGVTFDSGGLSIKPTDGMADMKCDMAGAATVVGVMKAIAELGIRKNVIGLCGLAENMISGTSYKLGDVIETRNGKTIEILNTDAEGRVVLADVLDVAVQHRPAAIVDLATLTGACVVALGTEVTGLMGNDQGLAEAVLGAAQAEGEPTWQLPMWDLYDELIKSKVADIRNVGEGRWGGAITAAKFLEAFVGDVPWVHLDIAGPAFAESPKPHRDAGATGVMVRSLVRWLAD